MGNVQDTIVQRPETAGIVATLMQPGIINSAAVFNAEVHLSERPQRAGLGPSVLDAHRVDTSDALKMLYRHSDGEFPLGTRGEPISNGFKHTSGCVRTMDDIIKTWRARFE
jgi:hypothetical protein